MMELLQTYTDQHGKETLDFEYNHDESKFLKRRFVKGVYSCPYQAGNRLHHFLNAFGLAIATNRTLLWHYCGAKCKGDCGPNDGPVCPKHGSDGDCAKVLQRAPWIASMDEGHTHWSASNFSKPVRPFTDSHPHTEVVLQPRTVSQ